MDPISYITLRAAGYMTTPGPDAVAEYIAIATARLDPDTWTININEAIALLALHMLLLDTDDDFAGGQIIGATVGKVGRQYRAAKSDDDDWSATKWGRQLTNLQNRSIVASGMDY